MNWLTDLYRRPIPDARGKSNRELLFLIIRNQGNIMSSLETLTAQVAASTSAMASAAALISGLQTKLVDAIAASRAGDDHAALDQLATDLASSTDSLSAAVAANTAAAAPVSTPAPTDAPVATPAPTETPVA